MRTIGSLLLTNSDFRIFLQDLNTIGRQVLADTANTLSNVAEETAKKVEPSKEEQEIMTHPGADEGPAPTTDELVGEVAQIGDVVADGLKKTGQEAVASAKENLTGDQQETLSHRLKAAVTKLTKRNDYSDSVSTIGLLISRYAKVYSRAADETISTLQEDVEPNEELDRAVKNGWALMSNFGDKKAWDELEKRFNTIMEHSKRDPEFENLMDDLAASIQKMLTDPDFFDSIGNTVDDLKEKAKETGSDSPLKKDIERFIHQARITLESVLNDQDIAKLSRTTMRLWNILSPTNATSNVELLTDTYTVFIPLLIQAIQYIPIPRLEVSVPEIDLLLENLILEPGRTINNSSFLPFKLQVETYNDLTIRKARTRIASNLKTLVTINIQGLSIRADEVGFWLRAHKGLLRLADEGIASFELDDRGIDISLDVEVGKDRLEKILSLRDVRVKIHHLSYTLRKSKFACLAWCFKPLLRPILRKVLEKQLATAIGDALHAANRELLYARERLRATQISNPQDLRTFVRAIVTRLTPEEDPDVYTSVGIVGQANTRGNVFSGVYAPGSIVKVWQEEGARAGEIVDDETAVNPTGRATAGVRPWRNEIFEVQGGGMTMGDIL